MASKKADIRLAHTLRRADQVVTQSYNEFLAPLGIRPTQYSVLKALHFRGTTTARRYKNFW